TCIFSKVERFSVKAKLCLAVAIGLATVSVGSISAQIVVDQGQDSYTHSGDIAEPHSAHVPWPLVQSFVPTFDNIIAATFGIWSVSGGTIDYGIYLWDALPNVAGA